MADVQGFISSLIKALEVNGDVLFEIALPDQTSETGYVSRAVSLSTVVDEMVNNMQFANELITNKKTILEAINEAYNHGGGGDVPENVVTSDTLEKKKIWVGTKAEFDAIQNKTEDIYITTDEESTDVDKAYVDGQVAAVNNALNETNNSLDTLWKLSKGQVWDITQEVETGLTTQPKGTKYESLIDVRGHSLQGENPSPDNPQEIHSVEQINIKKIGKNLFNSNDIFSTGYYDSNGIYQSSNTWKMTKINVRNTTITLSGAPTSTPRVVGVKNDIITVISQITNKTIDIADFDYILIPFKETDRATLMVEFGEVATNYEPYTEESKTITPPTPLNGINNYFDFADVENGVWVRNFNKAIFTAVTAFAKDSGRAYLTVSDADNTFSDDTKAPIMSDKFKTAYYRGASTTGGITLRFNYNQINFFADSFKDYDTLAEVNNWFKDNAPVVIYKTTEPTTEPINADDLEFLKSLTNLDTESTNIIITDQNGNDISYLMEYIIKLSEVN